MNWYEDAEHPRFFLREDGTRKCKECGKHSPRSQFEDLRHFSDCVGWGVSFAPYAEEFKKKKKKRGA